MSKPDILPWSARGARRADPGLPAASLATVPVRKTRLPAPQPDGPAADAATGHPAPAGDAPAGDGPVTAVRAGDIPIDDDPATLIAWWQRLKRGSEFPSPDDIDATAIAAAWPEAVLLGYDPANRDIARASRLGGGEFGTIEYTPMVTEWLLALGRKAVRGGAPLHETRRFPIGSGLAAYRIVALPLSADRRGADHVLCRIGPA